MTEHITSKENHQQTKKRANIYIFKVHLENKILFPSGSVKVLHMLGGLMNGWKSLLSYSCWPFQKLGTVSIESQFSDQKTWYPPPVNKKPSMQLLNQVMI